MQKRSTCFSLLLALCLLSATVKADIRTLYDNEMPDHPRLLMPQGAERDIVSAFKTDEAWQNIHRDILEECSKIITLPVLERQQTGRRLLAVSREALRRIFYLSYAYRTTNDAKYAERAEKEMLAVSAFSDWNPSHFLDVAEMTLAVAIGYDWLYAELPADSRNIIRDAIITKGLQPSLDSKNNWFLDAHHNWNQVCNAGMAFGALAVYEDQPELSSRIISRSIESVRKPMYEYSPDGAYPEGYAYWDYGTTFNIFLIDALEKIYGKDHDLLSIDGFMDTASYFEHMTAPSGNSFNYGDCGKEHGLSPAMFWFARKTNNPSLLWVEKRFLHQEYKRNYLRNRFLPAALVWGASMSIDKIQPPAELTWCGGGSNPVALMRTSWDNPDAIYLALKGGTASSNHAHMDAGSFIMEADGVRWAMDFGSQDYESLESRKLEIWSNKQESQRWQVFRYNNYVHNTPTINDKLHNVTGKAEILVCTDDNEFMSATTDLSAIFEGEVSHYKRGIAIVDTKYAVIRDEICTLTNKESRLRWTMLTPAEVIIEDSNTIRLQKDGKTLRMNIHSGLPVETKTWTTQSPNDYDAPNTSTTLVGFECTIPAGQNLSIDVYMLPSEITVNKRQQKPLDEWK